MLWSFLSIYYIVQLVTGSNLRFADDVVLFSESPQELQLTVEELRTANNKVDLEINESKTKVMLNINVEIQPIMTGNVALDQVDRYTYLGQLISIHRDWEPELILCGCMGTCTTGHCAYKRNGLSCSDSCRCGDSCDNPHNYDLEEESGDDEVSASF
ncbi:putative uncharacterized transposon-derived protein F52C9.6 [Nymphon striatum]|nr:putative uncharacterized transposon-derived protein F52C9.6 [Nymphon striatum]